MPQGFKYVYNDYGKDPTRITEQLMTDGEAGFANQAIKIVGGRITKAEPTDPIAGFLTTNVTAGKDKPAEYVLAREGDWYEAAYTGIADAGFVSGASEVALAADGLSADAATIVGGPLAIFEVNTERKTARVKVKNRQFS
ncbi:hypothetical protein AWU65_20395 [Paenibacillus glucanolyticus]|uniref:Uncharacterized protein n=1 Tax=Paenibacillus glucanolyticus TaxID=59843 RepID=A0A163LGN8_9BACL|nr:hypothetical protein [Paenibacillus glucanolyticus]KZS48118.1 hypothetical protein AWU65_20395 [Paenibacillus glucanolyticus]